MLPIAPQEDSPNPFDIAPAAERERTSSEGLITSAKAGGKLAPLAVDTMSSTPQGTGGRQKNKLQQLALSKDFPIAKLKFNSHGNLLATCSAHET